MKRQRGRGRKPGGGGGGGGGNHNHNHGNRSLESNGPDVKIRGTAAQIYEKYAQYARDAQSGGDRVKYENYLQHAEHYYRVMAATMPRERLLQQQQEGGMQGQQPTVEGNVPPQENVVNADQGETTRPGDEAVGADEGDDEVEASDDGEEAEAAAPEVRAQQVQQTQEDGDGQEGGRNRRRRGRRRPADGEGPKAGGGDTEARSALDSLARKQGALTGG